MLTRLGSSPRERGTRDRDRGRLDTRRIIPARAGNTSGGLVGIGRRPDHPRASGEHFQVWSVHSIVVGSSPRERGTRSPGRPDPARRRIIPARAGNTSTWSVSTGQCSDHPRASGEHSSLQVAGIECLSECQRTYRGNRGPASAPFSHPLVRHRETGKNRTSFNTRPPFFSRIEFGWEFRFSQYREPLSSPVRRCTGFAIS